MLVSIWGSPLSEIAKKIFSKPHLGGKASKNTVSKQTLQGTSKHSSQTQERKNEAFKPTHNKQMMLEHSHFLDL